MKSGCIILTVILGFFSRAPEGFAQRMSRAHPGPEGIFIFAGNALPKELSYRVSRKVDRDKDWEVIGILNFPSNLAAFQGRLMSADVQTENTAVTDERITNRIWMALNRSRTSDSLYIYASNPAWLAATGNGMWDKAVKPQVLCTYRVQTLDRRGTVLREEFTSAVRFPGATPRFDIKGSKIIINERGVTADFKLNPSSALPAGCRVYRSDYLRQNFKEISAQIFYLQNEEIHIRADDATAHKKMLYSYFLLPYDDWGNVGTPSDTMHLYNAEAGDISSRVIRFKADALLKEKALRITWKIHNPADIVSVDLYKGVEYDGRYVKVGSFSPADSVYVDRAVNPITTYFYTIVQNAAFGRSFPSGRISAMLPASDKNLFPPMNVSAERTDGTVKLTWSRTERDTRGYYVYRSDSFTGRMQLASSLILSEDSVVHFIDSVKKLPASSVWVYAVADVNTSYEIGPLSEKIPVPGVNAFMPTPADVSARLENGAIHLLWTDLSEEYAGVSGYWIYRRAEDADGKEVEPQKRITTVPLFGKVSAYQDTSIEEGVRYFYSVQAVGLDISETGAPGMETGCFVPVSLPLPPANTKAFNTDKGVALQWDMPADPTITEVRIYRTSQGSDWTLLKSLQKTAEDFTDNTVKKNVTYFFHIATVNAKNRESKTGSPIGVRAGN